MLQAVLGLDAARIASAFLVAPAAMGAAARPGQGEDPRRRASPSRSPARPTCRPGSARCSTPSTPPTAPAGRTRPAPTRAVAASPRRRSGWRGSWSTRARGGRGAGPPGTPAPLRGPPRGPAVARTGDYVPLAEQETSLWSRPMIEEAERELAAAAALRSIGRFQLEAAIQSVHAQRAVDGADGLGGDRAPLRRTRPPLADLGRLGRPRRRPGERPRPRGRAGGPRRDRRRASVLNYQPYWAVRAHLLGLSGDVEAARDAYSRAIGLSEDPACASSSPENATGSPQGHDHVVYPVVVHPCQSVGIS